MEKKECEEITTEGPSFFQIVTAPLTTDFLRIPPCFVKHIEEEAEESVTLRGHSGVGTWHIKLERNADSVFLREGWKDFHRDNSLEEGEFLLFRYDGAMVFTVRIFKNSCLERDVQQPLIPPQTASSQGCCSKNPGYKVSRFGAEHFESPNKKSKALKRCWKKFGK